MLFEFILRPLEEVQPWGGDEPNLHWFGLTDGWCWWNVGSQQLFRYSQVWLDRWAGEYPKLASDPPYVDYQISRTWEDLLACLPDVLDSLPDDFAQRIEDVEELEALNGKAFLWAADKNDASAWDLQELAFRWLWNRGWNSGYLRCPPKIWLWTQGDTLHIRWDNRDVKDDGVPAWEATHGVFTMPVAEFVEEVKSFDARLMSQMTERIKAVCAGALRPDITVNPAYLAQDEQQRPLQLAAALVQVRDQQDWDKVREALATLERMCYNNGVEGL